MDDSPVFEVEPERGWGRSRILHRSFYHVTTSQLLLRDVRPTPKLIQRKGVLRKLERHL